MRTHDAIKGAATGECSPLGPSCAQPNLFLRLKELGKINLVRPLYISAFTLGVLLAGTDRLHADPLPAAVETLEMMMEAIAADGEFLGRHFGADPDNPLSFTANVDPDNKTFNYAFQPETTYAGEPLSLSGDGSFDVESDAWTGVANGQCGASDDPPWWAQWEFDIDHGDPYEGNFDWETTILGVKLDAHRRVTIEWSASGGFALSTADLAFTINDTVVATGTAEDRVVRRSLESYDVYWGTTTVTLVPPIFVVLDGSYDDGTGLATGSLTVIPEPASLVLLALGGLGILRWRIVHRA